MDEMPKSLHLSFTPDGRRVVKRGADETGHQVVADRAAGGWSVFWIDPPFPGQSPTGYSLPVDALHALERHLAGVAK